MTLDASKSVELALLVVFGLALITFLTMSVILNYHWTRYRINHSKISLIRSIYFGVSSIIVVAMTIFFIRTIQ